MEEAIFFGESEGRLFLRATGHVTALVCPSLKARLFARLDAQKPLEEIYLDLGSCEYMDSTFLGLIVGAQKRFAKRRLAGKDGAQSGREGVPVGKEGAQAATEGEAGKDRKVILVGTSATCLGLLRTIGVLGMVEIQNEGPAFPVALERLDAGAKASARFILDAHEELTGLSAENKSRFAALTDLLKGAADSESHNG